jgi:hypothetical protein
MWHALVCITARLITCPPGSRGDAATESQSHAIAGKVQRMATVVPPISAAHIEKLGRLTAGATQLDGICETLIGALVGVPNDRDSQERVRTLTQGMRTSSLVGMVTRLTEHAGQSAGDLKQWANDVNGADVKRNDMVHAIWLFQFGDHAVSLKRRTQSGSDIRFVSLADMDTILETQDRLIETGLGLAKLLGAI